MEGDDEESWDSAGEELKSSPHQIQEKQKKKHGSASVVLRSERQHMRVYVSPQKGG
jgi:hypothetical protein